MELFNKKILRLTMLSMLFALTLIISYIESIVIPPLPIPGARLGLSNIILMFVLLKIDLKSSYIIMVLKCLFIIMTKGLFTASVSLCGTFLSLTVMYLLMLLFRDKISVLILSILGAIFHNIGQLVFVTIAYDTLGFLWTLPILVAIAVFTGTFTALLMKLLDPYLKSFVRKNK